MAALVDDVGSFPLPPNTDGKLFQNAYVLARRTIAEGRRLEDDEFLLGNFNRVVLESFRKKTGTGLDVVNYPQHFDMHRQLAEPLRESMNEGTYLISKERAVLPEVHLINSEAGRLSEITGGKIKLRTCIMGPMELYQREVGTIIHEDVLKTLAEDVRRFAKNSVLNSKYVQTVAVSLDEPSFGFVDISTDRETILDVLETAFDFEGATKQIHLHSPSRISDLLDVKNVDVLSIEYAASPKNLDSVSKNMLDQADKQVRVGISRTDINSIVAELYDSGITTPSAEQLVEDEQAIRKRFETARAKYRDRLTFTGPDCGLGGWPTQEAAELLLTRTVRAVRATQGGL